MAYKKSKNYDSVSAFGESEFKTLPSGGYVCRLMFAEEMTDKNGNPMLHVAWDIIDGEYKNYFMDTFHARKKAMADKPDAKEVKYPFEGQKWISILDYEDKTKESSRFKGFCSALENSGADIWMPNGELNLEEVGKAEVGVVYQNVEHEYNGKTYWRTEPWAFRSVETIESGDYYVPDDKPLPSVNTSGTAFAPSGSADSFSAAEDDIPF